MQYNYIITLLLYYLYKVWKIKLKDEEEILIIFIN